MATKQFCAMMMTIYVYVDICLNERNFPQDVRSNSPPQVPDWMTRGVSGDIPVSSLNALPKMKLSISTSKLRSPKRGTVLQGSGANSINAEEQDRWVVWVAGFKFSKISFTNLRKLG
jgi:hypothetical protein